MAKTFKKNNEMFPNPHLKRQDKISVLPPMLDANPDFKDNILQYAVDNLNTLSIETLYEYIHQKALPELLKTR